MAEVFKAKSFGVEGFEKILVIKRILPELARSPEFAEMFIHEAKLAVRLSHANIVQVFDLGKAPSSSTSSSFAYYIAMEYVHGLAPAAARPAHPAGGLHRIGGGQGPRPRPPAARRADATARDRALRRVA